MRREKPLGVNRRRATHARRRDCLPINVIRAVARHENARHVGHRAVFADDVATGVHLDLLLENFGARRMADGDKHARARQEIFRAGLELLQFHTGHPAPLHAKNFHHGGIPNRFDFRIRQRALGHDFRCAQRVAAVNQKNLRAEARQIKRLFARGIAAAHHNKRLVAEQRQRPVAGGAVSHAFRFQQVLARHAEMPVARARGDDDRLRGDCLAVHDQREWPFGEVHILHRAETRLRPEALRLFLHPRHQFVAVHAFRETWEIFHDARRGEQPAGLLAGEHERLEVGARRVKRRRPARAARTDDDNLFHRRAQGSLQPRALQVRAERIRAML